jgi:hypothetical protein
MRRLQPQGGDDPRPEPTQGHVLSNRNHRGDPAHHYRLRLLRISCRFLWQAQSYWRMEVIRSAQPSFEMPLRSPITGITACCARTTSGNAAALPSPAINSRRRIGDLLRWISEAYRGPGCLGTGYVEGIDFRLRTLNAFTGRLKPLRLNSSVNSASTRVSTALKTLMSIRI